MLFRSLPAKPQLTGDDLRNYLATTKGIALIAYIQKLGSHHLVTKDGPAMPVPLNPDSYRSNPPLTPATPTAPVTPATPATPAAPATPATPAAPASPANPAPVPAPTTPST